MQPARKVRAIEVKLPAEAFQTHRWDPDEVAEELRLLWLLEQVRQRRLGYGKAAELADLPVALFLKLMGKHRITPFDYDSDDLAEELRSAP